MKHLIFTALFLLSYTVAVRAQIVFPTPNQVEMQTGNLILGKKVSMYAEDTTAFYLNLFREEVLSRTPIKWQKKESKADICWITDSSLPPEGYRIRIHPQQMVISASDKGGFTYAVQTLRQWVAGSAGSITFACASVTDYPRTQWRCFLLDSGRQFQKIATIRKYIDMASLLKMNYFHWHLTEGLGWRIEIKQYPHLTRTGGSVGKGEEQQGFYTQEEIRDIIEYARQRNITIVPEIDMPGHAEAALSAYPELGCFGLPVEIPQSGFTQNIFCAGKDGTLRFLKNVLDEVCALFPSPYIHLGGDEAPKGNWDQCPDCRKRITTEGLKDSHDLQLWFSAQMANYLKSKGRKAIFWGDVVYHDGYPLPDNTVIQWWNYRGHKDLALRNAVKHHYPVICSSNYYTYLNFPVTPWKGYTEARTFDLKDVYLNNPSDKAISEKNPLILGMSCALWTDDGVTERMIDRRLFPRILALSEQMWHEGEALDFDRFYRNILHRKAWFEEAGFEFGPALKEDVTKDYKWDLKKEHHEQKKFIDRNTRPVQRLPARTNPTRISQRYLYFNGRSGIWRYRLLRTRQNRNTPYRPFMQRRHQTDTTLFRFPRISSGTLRTDDRYALRSCANPLQQ